MSRIRVNRHFGDTPNYTLHEELRRQGLEHAFSQIWTAEPAIVYDYDVETQRVDVILRNHHHSAPVKEVPILGSGGRLAEVRPFRTAKDWLKLDPRPFTFPDVGVLLYFRSDASESFVLNPAIKKGKTVTHSEKPKYIYSKLNTNFTHAKMGAYFLPQSLMKNDALPSVVSKDAGTDINQVGPDDYSLVHDSGAFVTIKKNGTVHVKSASGQRVYVNGTSTFVLNDGSIIFNDATIGPVVKSANGKLWRLGADDTGNVTTTEVTL